MTETQLQLEQRLEVYEQIVDLSDRGYLRDPQSIKLADRYRLLIPELQGRIDDLRYLVEMRD